MALISKYGLDFDAESYDPAKIERFMIRNGGRWTEGGRTYGLGLIEHFKLYWSLLWPEDSQTWWTDLILKNIIENQFVSLVGPGSSWKSGTVSRIALMDWSCFPECTTVIMSSTDMEGLKSRIYGETSMMWNRAHDAYDWFPGCAIDSKCVITEVSPRDEERIRDMRNSIVGVPCKTSAGKFVGMGKYSGRKNRRVWCIGDEYQFMEQAILDAQNNLISNGGNLVPGIIRDKDDREFGKPRRGYKCVFIGNTNPSRPGNPLDIVSEPEMGWGSISDDNKTKVWKCKKLADHPVQCRCINLDGMDSPNSPFPIERPKWDNLAGPHKVAAYTVGSEAYWSQGRGLFKFGLAQFKIITKEICDQYHAFDDVIFAGEEPTTKIGMVDAAYGGGDRCPLGWLEFGKCVDGKARIKLHPLWLVPIVIRKDLTPEDQIAVFTKEKMESVGVPPENFFFDGRGSLAMALASHWSSKVNSIEFGGSPTDRPAGPDIFTEDKITKMRRLKLAKEHFSKFVTELWWSWRYVVESDQIRGLQLDVVLDAQPREWYKVGNDKIEVETKKEMKKRTGCSPDLADMVVTGIEGARRRGFVIANISVEQKAGPRRPSQLQIQSQKYEKMIESKQLAVM